MITVIGSLNMDLVTKVKRTPKVGETTIGRTLSEIPGGKGANQAVAIGRLEGTVQMIGALGKDEFSKILHKNLKKSNVIDLVEDFDTSSGVAMIMVNDDGDNSIVVIPGANERLAIQHIDDKMENIKQSDLLLMQLEIPLEIVEYSLEIARKNEIYTILNPAPAKKLSESILSKVDLLIPNKIELEMLTEMTIDSDKKMKKACNQLLAQGVKEIIVTLGGDGSFYYDGNVAQHFKAEKVKAIDTTAAGDSFAAAVAYQLDQGASMMEAIPFATKVAAKTVITHGAQSSLPYRNEIE